MNKTIKIICIIVILLADLMVFSQNVYAAGSNKISIGDIVKGAEDFINAKNDDPKKTGEVIDENKVKDMSDILYNTLFIIGVIVAVIVGLMLGIKYMAGSITEKVKIKESIIAYIAGCVVIFGAFGIWKLVVNVLQTVK